MSLAEQEQWRPMPGGWEDLYEVSNLARVRNASGYVMKLVRHEGGYLRVTLSHKGVKASVLVHRQMLAAFVRPPAPGEVARHLNDDQTDNRLENLAWGSVADNNQDMIDNGGHGTMKRTHCVRGHAFDQHSVLHTVTTGKDKGRQYRRCLLCAKRSVVCEQCGKELKYSLSIYDHRRNVHGPESHIRKPRNTKFVYVSDDVLTEIRSAYRRGERECTHAALARKYGLSRTKIRRILAAS